MDINVLYMMHTVCPKKYYTKINNRSNRLHMFFSSDDNSLARVPQSISVWHGNASNQDCKALQSRALS